MHRRYRVKASGILVSEIYEKIGKLSLDRAAFKSKWPRNFARPSQLLPSKVHVFWDQNCLQSGKKWEDGFIEGLSLSIVFVPFLCRAAITKWQEQPDVKESNPRDWFSPDQVDNFLLECIIALELHERLPSILDAARITRSEGPIAADSVFACKRIMPIFVDEDCHGAMSDAPATATIKKAEEILRSLDILAQDCAISRFDHLITLYCRPFRFVIMRAHFCILILHCVAVQVLPQNG